MNAAHAKLGVRGWFLSTRFHVGMLTTNEMVSMPCLFYTDGFKQDAILSFCCFQARAGCRIVQADFDLIRAGWHVVQR